ncbi:MAG TPA: hypothetical protein VK508_02335 [Cyclobacteriaceae bacterium]|nr:hypothetical protein [Cyclobacteriaceae bacterium]
MWNAIYKKLWIVLLAPMLAGGAAYFFTGKDAGKYKSVAVIEASIPDPPAGAQTLQEISDPNQYYDNMVETMKTEIITSMGSYRLLLHDLEKDIAFRPPAIQYSPPKKELIRSRLEKKLSGFELLSETDPTEQTIFKVISNTDYNLANWIRNEQMIIKRRPGTNEIEVVCSTEDPFLSAFASNALSQEYIRYETAISSPPANPALAANDSTAWFRDEVERLRKDLEQKTGEVKEAGNKSQSPVDDIRFDRAKANKVAEFEMRIVEEDWELNGLRDQLAKMERPEPMETNRATADVSGNAKIQTIRNKIDQLSKLYAEGGSKEKKLDSIITRLRQQVNDETARLQTASQKTLASRNPNLERNRTMLQTRIRRHEENIESLRRDIRKLKNTNRATATGAAEVAKLRQEQEDATTAYNRALAELTKAESKQPSAVATSRASHYLILKEKALPSARPQSPWALTIILSAVIGTLAVTIIIVVLTHPAPPPSDDIFLRVNYANQRRVGAKKKHPREGDVSLSDR